VNKSEEKIQALLEEIELLKLENSLLRKAAGIKSPDEELERSTQVSEAERNALLKKSI